MFQSATVHTSHHAFLNLVNSWSFRSLLRFYFVSSTYTVGEDPPSNTHLPFGNRCERLRLTFRGTRFLAPFTIICSTVLLVQISANTYSLIQVFTPTASANYTGPLSNLNGLPAIQAGLAASVADVFSQHLVGTTVIDIHEDSKSANSTTYFRASLFGDPYYIGSVVYLYGFYADDEVKTAEGWRISNR